MLYARQRLLAAAALGRLFAIDTPSTEMSDERTRLEEVDRVVRLGFAAKAAIHPAHIASINSAFSPSKEAIAKARSVLEHYCGGASIADGRMIDEAIVRRARQVLAFYDAQDSTLNERIDHD